MGESVIITTLVENTVNIGGLQAEHGLSFLVRAGGRRLLFDTGQTDLLVRNACQMGLPLEGLCGIVLSHGHYDHTSGLAAVASPHARIFLHPAATQPKFTLDVDGKSRSIGMKPESLAAVQRAETEGHSIVWTAKPTEVMDGIWVTGEIPRQNHFENTGGRFYLDAACTRPDPLADDQALFFDTAEGVVVVLGCAHAGAVNTLEYISDLTRRRPIRAVIGGMHLLAAAADRIEKTLDAFRRWNIQRITPAHCTGAPAVAKLWAAFPERCSTCSVGTSIEFQRT
jgi:7,8-dihydropterin-6-yl-methyl-4-(beta-D-ribofuranosyl)aminobenzene 5'-phosphate synthase